MKVSSHLLRLVLSRFALGFLVMGLFFFLPAGTLNYWEAWMYMLTLFVPLVFTLFYLLKNDPKLLERRMRTREKESEQRRILNLSLIFFLAAYILPGFDQRFGWSRAPAALVIFADLIVLAGYLLVIRVFRENSYASRVVEVEQDQQVISSGPYAIVRHPMYLGALMMYLLSPLALGSYWAMIPAAFLIYVLVARIRNEEEVLSRELKGYTAYIQKVRYRLLPGIW
jgi:protein-S-isoprenylcysteine O-methyltransferase Ste14